MITRDEYDRFLQAVEYAREDGTLAVYRSGLEVMIEGDEIETVIYDFPGAWVHPQNEWDEWNSYLQPDPDPEQFPAIAEAFYDYLSACAEVDAADRATRRAESGYAQ
jgi:hypothetical protein